MSEYDLNVEVNIRRETAAIQTASFDIPLIVAEHNVFLERTRTYQDIDSILQDFPITSNVYKIASRLFSSEIGMGEVVVGKRQINRSTFTVTQVTEGGINSIIINGTAYQYQTLENDEREDVAAALAASYTNNPLEGIVLTNNMDGTITITSEQNVLWVATASQNINIDQGSSTETWVNAISQSLDENPAPYVILCETHNLDDITSIAQYIESTDSKFYYTSTSDISLKGVGALPNGLAGLTRTAIVWSQEANNEYPEAKHVAEVIPATVGSTGWCFRSAAGLTASKVTTTERNNIFNKNLNLVLNIGQRLHFQQGTTLEGNGIFEIMIKDWIKARIQEEVFGLFVRLRKVPMTQEGSALIEQAIRRVLDEGVSNGAIEPNYSVTAPLVRDISMNDKIKGIMRTFNFTAYYQGEVRKAVINGVLTYDV